MIFQPPGSYSAEYLQRTSCKPFIDGLHEQLMQDVMTTGFNYLDESYINADANPTALTSLFTEFKTNFQTALENSKLNTLIGFDSFKRVDICIGCAQYMDNLHIKHDVQVLEDEYRYHTLLNPALVPKTKDTLEPNKHLIISLPFSKIGATHPQMTELLDHCLKLNIPVHIDGAWITAAKNVSFDFSHPAVHSVAVSMSKGYGLAGWNRIGLRWTKHTEEDAITIMNDYLQVNSYCVAIGNYFLKNVPIDHLWNTHKDNYSKLCQDFNLVPTDTIHMAKDGVYNIGLSPLLRYLEKNV
jgi:hypothetical protein